MDELINLVSARTGLSPDMAKTAVATVIDYLKDKLPAPIAGQVDAVLSGGGGGLADQAGGLVKGLGGLMGKK